MKNLKIGVAIFFAAAYLVFLLSIPHETPRSHGLETDLVMSYLNGAVAIENIVEKGSYGSPKESFWLWQDLNPFDIHGIGYSVLLWLGGSLFESGYTVWDYFRAAKWISVLSACSLIILAFVWLGLTAGILASSLLWVSSLFFELAYSGSTDMVSVALLLWSAFLLHRRSILLSGLFLGVVCIIRYEFLIFVPFGLVYLRKDLFTCAKFLSPILVLFILNFTIADFPPQGFTYNLALHYLNDDQQPDMFMKTTLLAYPTPWAIIFADFGSTLSIFLRDLSNTTAKLGVLQICPLLFFPIILLSTRKFAIIWVSLLCHYFFITFTVFSWSTIRYYTPEIVGLIFCGSYLLITGLKTWRKWLILALIPWYMFNLNSLGEEIADQVSHKPNHLIQLAPKLTPKDTVLSLRPLLPVLANCRWRYWPIEESNIYRYCLDQGIDYILFDGFAFSLRSEWIEKLSNSNLAKPEFEMADYVENAAILYRVIR